MGLLGRVLSRGYCAFCKTRRDYILKKHIGTMDVFLSMVFSFTLGSAIWELYEPRILVIFAFSLSIAELFIYARWRSHIVCRQCGFDPVLYNSAPSRARDKVKSFYEKKLKQSGFLMSNSPLLELHRESLKREALKRRLRRVKGGDSSSLTPVEASSNLEIQ